jgi:hypothetical protein
VAFKGGTVQANPHLTLDLPGDLFQWTGGTIFGLTTNLNSVTIAGAGSVYLGDTFYNQGMIRQTNTALSVINGYSYFHNLAGGVYDFAGDGCMWIHSEYGAYFRNYGLLRKSSGTGVSAITNSFLNQGGSVEVDSGTLQIQTYAQGGGALTVALGGTNAGQSGMLKVVDAATLNGPLNVVLANEFTPAVGQSFQILACGSRSGFFTATNMLAGFSLSYSNSGAYLQVVSPLPRTLVDSARSGTNFSFSFQTESGSSYTVQYNDDLRTANWQFLQTVTGDGALQSFVIPMTNGPQRFFRVRQL